MMEAYPHLASLILGRSKEMQFHMEKCRDFENGDCSQYSSYVHGFWLLWLEDQRRQGKLVEGKDFISLKFVWKREKEANAI